MGLIKAGIGALGGTLADQWKEFFYCDALPNDVLVRRGQKQISGRSSNTKGNDNVISNGSGIAVADGQCMMIVEQGKVVEICAEPGEFRYDSSTEPSVFTGSLGDSILETFKTIGKRFTYGGDTGKDQRVYYFNTKEILDNKFGTATPIPFRVVDSKIGLDIDVSVRCNGVFTYKLVNPLLFYQNVCGNVSYEYGKDEIAETLRSSLLTYLAPAFSKISDLEVRPNQLPGKNLEIRDALRSSLTEEWTEKRGLEIVDLSINSASIPKEDEELIKNAQRTAMYKDPTMAAAKMVDAQSEAMTKAASNSAGAMTGFMGMGFAQNAGGGVGVGELYKMGEEKKAAEPRDEKNAAGSWTCECGAVSNGKFCTECGKKKPDGSWTCSCGSVNAGKFCPECGSKRPEADRTYKCNKCGWEPEDPKNPPKFCPECGDRFDESDAK